MKKYLSWFFGGVFLSVFAYSLAYNPSPTLEDKLSEVAERLETIIDDRGELFRGKIITLVTNLGQGRENDERVMYIVQYLLDALLEDEVIDTDPTASATSSDYLSEYTIDDPTYGTEVEVIIEGGKRKMASNGLPNHDTGDFPNSGNPNTISEQSYNFEMPTSNTASNQVSNAQMPGVAVNGVFFEPGTAEFVECSDSTRHIEGLQDAHDLGMDHNEAHVQPGGLYHYHGVPTELIAMLAGDDDLIHLGFSADGALIYYSRSGAHSSSYRLKSGTRDSSGTCTYRNQTITVDGTTYDGVYEQDREYVAGLGDLDECNGTTIDGTYAYIITDEYPFISRCLKGTADDSFRKNGGGQGGQGAGPTGEGPDGSSQGDQQGPPDSQQPPSGGPGGQHPPRPRN